MLKRTVIFILTLMLCCTMLFAGCDGSADPEKTLKVLCIGNSYSRDMLYYVSQLAQDICNIEAAYLDDDNATVRDHARNLVFDSDNYTLWKADPKTGVFASAGSCTITAALEGNSWDVVILHQNLLSAGYPGTYNGDLDHLIDHIRDHSQAKIYWNMTWAAADTLEDPALRPNFDTYYSGSCAVMYNAILTAAQQHIVGDSSTFGKVIDGWIPTGIVIQKLRDSLGEAVTANGHNLSLELGRLAAGMTLLKTLMPEYDLNALSAKKVAAFLNASTTDEAAALSDSSGYAFRADDLPSIVTAVETACALTEIPEKVAATAAPISESADITPLRTTAPIKPYFPDLVVLDDGTIIIGAYENITHKPNATASSPDYAQEGVGRLVVWRSTDNGATWEYDTPLLVVDEKQMEAWGIAKVSDRYELLKSGATTYNVMIDPRDPNFGIVHTDITGDGVAEEVLLFTFWNRTFTNTGTHNNGYLTYSIDGGKTWAVPQELLQENGSAAIKRGCIASFSDGQILIPYYNGNTRASLLMEFSTEENTWVLLQDSDIPNLAALESEQYNEISLAAPDPDSDTVYAYCRDSGAVLQSDDRGLNWTLVGNEDGLIHQPGFAVLDENRLFTTWAQTTIRPRNIFGKVFDIKAGWDATQTQPIYISPDKSNHDMADPSCALLADGRVLVVAYDTTYRSIVGVYIDPTEAKWQPQ